MLARSDVKVSGLAEMTGRTAILSLDFPEKDNAEIAYRLDREYGIMTRCGMHCAPLAHRTLGTFPAGNGSLCGRTPKYGRGNAADGGGGFRIACPTLNPDKTQTFFRISRRFYLRWDILLRIFRKKNSCFCSNFFLLLFTLMNTG